MNCRARTLAGLICAALLMTPAVLAQSRDDQRNSIPDSSQSAPGGGSAVANGPLELLVPEPGGPTHLTNNRPPAPAETRSDDDEESHALDDALIDREIRSAPPKQESRSLGQPRSASVPASPNESRSSDRESSWLERLWPQVGEIARVIGALVAVLGLAWSVRAIVRRAGGMASADPRPSGVVEIMARYPMPGSKSRGQELLLIKVGRRMILTHSASGGSGSASRMTPLTEITEPNEVAALLSRLESGSTPRHAGRFREALQKFQAAEVPQPTSGARQLVHRREADRLIGASDHVPEIVDLTRSGAGGFFGLFRAGGRGGR